MTYCTIILTLFLTLSQPTSPAVTDTGLSPSGVPTIGALLFHSGYLMIGEAVLQGDVYVLKSKLGTSRHQKTLVEFAAKDSHDVYLYLRNKIDLADYNAVFQLATWCKKNSLTDEMMLEYERAKLVAPNAETAAVVHSLIQLAHKQTVAATMSVPSSATETDVSFDYLTWSKSVPLSVLETYAKVVQPILLRRCGNVDCHGESSSQQFRLAQITTTNSRTVTLQNLKMVLEYMDLERPYQSPFLHVTTAEHGGIRSMASPQSQSNFATVYQWTAQTAQRLTPDVAATLQLTYRKWPVKSQTANTESPSPAVSPSPSPSTSSSPIRQVSEWTPKPAEENRSSTAEKTPTNPFDPNVFNRMYHHPK